MDSYLLKLVNGLAGAVSCLSLQKSPKRLFVRESATLGDRRFVAVVQYECKRFLIAGCPASIALLATLPDSEETEEAQR